MTEQSDSPLVRGLIDHEAVAADGTEVEDATETLLRLRTEGELPDGVAESDGVPTGRGTGDDRDPRDPT